MDQYITGQVIRQLREKCGLTQLELAIKLSISDKTVSKWETGKGYPDITLLEGLSKALNVSITELLMGNPVDNTNLASNMLKTHFYVCPICGNVTHSIGQIALSCHGITLPALEAEDYQVKSNDLMSIVEDDMYIRIDHPMTKIHYLSFIAGVSFDRVELVKLYPEGPSEARLKQRGLKHIYFYCNKDGLYRIKVENSALVKKIP